MFEENIGVYFGKNFVKFDENFCENLKCMQRNSREVWIIIIKTGDKLGINMRKTKYILKKRTEYVREIHVEKLKSS